MVQNPESALKDWCATHLTEEKIKKVSDGHTPPMALYRSYADNGWLDCANVFADKKNLPTFIVRMKTLSRYSGDLSLMVGVNSICAMMLSVFGNDEQKEISQDALKGKALFSFSLTEPDAGSDIENLKTVAQPFEGGWILNGKKYFATGAGIADYILIVARSSQEGPLNKGISVFLVPQSAPGVKIKPQEKIAGNSFSSCEITLDSVELPKNAVIGPPNGAWGAIAFTGGMERLMVAATCVGLSQRILRYLFDFAQTRIIRKKPLYEIQLINHQLADMATRIKAAELLVENAAGLLSNGQNPAVEICGAKVFASELQQEISMAAMKIMGGRAYLKEYPVERWFREGLLSLYAGGTNELQKDIIARKLPHTLQSL